MKDLNFLIQRYSDNGKSSQGLLFNKAVPHLLFCHVLEDEFREVKVLGETRIDAGLFELKIRKEDSPLTIEHRKQYNEGFDKPWFFYHIEITGLPRHKFCYFHAGNKETHTDGCPLLNDTANNNSIEAGDMSRSRQATKRFYDLVYPHLLAGGRAFVEIRDEKFLY